MKKGSRKTNMFFNDAAQIDGAILDAARETELLVHDLRTYFSDVKAALKQVGSTQTVKEIQVTYNPEDGQYDLSLRAILAGPKEKTMFEFEFNIKERKVSAGVKESGSLSWAVSHYTYNQKAALKRDLSKWALEALPALDRAKIVADAAGVSRPRF